MTPLHTYTNGNTTVRMFTDGTKERLWSAGEVPIPATPESIDLKITDWCGAGCAWCHEQSTTRGQHANLIDTRAVLRGLPQGTELAIGGGDPLSHPHLTDFLISLRIQGLIANITVNGRHLARHLQKLQAFQRGQILYGIGVSFYKPALNTLLEAGLDNTIVHMIAGADSIFDALRLPSQMKVLILGYKDYGRGTNFLKRHQPEVEHNLKVWNYFLPTLLRQRSVCFDNLALTQLHVKDRIGQELWDKRYMGNDGTFTMYVDAVSQTYAKSSTSPRLPWEGQTIQQMFSAVRKAT